MRLEGQRKKELLLSKINVNWKLFCESFAGLTDDQLMEKGVVGLWSVRDLFAHVSTWEEEFIKALSLIIAEKPDPEYSQYGDIDKFNARELERKRDFSLERLKYELVSTHQRLLEQLKLLPDIVFATNKNLIRRLRDNYGHYQEHAAQITRWCSKGLTVKSIPQDNGAL
jgi:uncharacterized damage-inducible protein DinB